MVFIKPHNIFQQVPQPILRSFSMGQCLTPLKNIVFSKERIISFWKLFELFKSCIFNNWIIAILTSVLFRWFVFIASPIISMPINYNNLYYSWTCHRIISGFKMRTLSAVALVFVAANVASTTPDCCREKVCVGSIVQFDLFKFIETIKVHHLPKCVGV